MSATASGNLFADLPDCSLEERFETLLNSKHIRIERIASFGQQTPPGQWYDQDQDEWVVLLRGEAGIQFEHEPEPRALQNGDYLFIPARSRHRVTYTSPNEHSIWLAIFIDSESPPAKSAIRV